MLTRLEDTVLPPVVATASCSRDSTVYFAGPVRHVEVAEACTPAARSRSAPRTPCSSGSGWRLPALASRSAERVPC